MGKVLEFKSRVSSRNQTGNVDFSEDLSKGGVVDFTEARQALLNQDRRQVKRTILTEFVGAFVVVPEKGLLKVNLYDISETGIAFDLLQTEGTFAPDEEVAMRVYLNHTTYFPFSVAITHARMIEEEGVIRHGANFMKGSLNDIALHHFIKFIENVSASLRKDTGDIMVSNIS